MHVDMDGPEMVSLLEQGAGKGLHDRGFYAGSLVKEQVFSFGSSLNPDPKL